jgi:hypothetical protein
VNINPTSGVSKRGRKRKATVVKEEENVSEDERVLSDNGDNHED